MRKESSMLKVKFMVAMVCSLAASSSALAQCCETDVFAEPETIVSDVWYSEPTVMENVVWPVSYETIVETPFVETEVWAEPVFDDAVAVNETVFWNSCECACPVTLASAPMIDENSFVEGTVISEQVFAAPDDSYSVARPVIDSPVELLPASDEDVAETTAEVELEDATDTVADTNADDEDNDTDELFSAPSDLE